MSEVKVNKITPRTDCGTTQLGDSGDTVTVTGDLRSDSLKAADGGVIISQSGTTITVGASGDTVSLASGASQSGFGRSGTVDWNTTPKTATFTAVSGDGFFCNTTSGGFTCNLPAGTAGSIVSLADYAATWNTGNLTVSPNGSQKIGGVNASVVLDTQGQSVTFVYVDDTQGWVNVQDSTSNERGRAFITATGGTETEDGNFKIHTFTGPGTFCVSQASSVAAENTVGYLVVAGGASGGVGGSNVTGGGGGAGGYREGKNAPIDNFTASPLVASAPTNAVTISATAFPITVGGGGAAAGPGDASGNPGSNSIFSTITSAGGGGGGGNSSIGFAGGSGGGGQESDGPGYAGNTPSVSPPQGQPGGTGSESGNSSGGGGGAGGAGSNPTAGTGGSGVSSSITGSPVTRAGGGASNGGSGGPGGGGASGGSPSYPNGPDTNGVNGTANTGGGSGAAMNLFTSGTGGSGIVVIRYKFQ